MKIFSLAILFFSLSLSSLSAQQAAQVGVQLSTSNGTWNNCGSCTYTYQWIDSSTGAISGGTAQTYTPVAGNVGHTLTVQVTAHNSSGPSLASTSVATATVAAASSCTSPSTYLFANNSLWNLPIGSGATWLANAQLASTGISINSSATGYNQPIYTSSSSDPLVAVANSGSRTGEPPSTFNVRIPVGAAVSSGSDMIISIDDKSSGTWCSFAGFARTSNTTATSQSGECESDTGNGLGGVPAGSTDQDEGAGTLRQADLTAGVINHLLRIQIDPTFAHSYSSSAQGLCPYCWPQSQEDGFGPTSYTGTINYGATIGIPAGTAEPGAVAGNAGAHMMWNALKNHGAMIRDTGSIGAKINFQVDQIVNPNDALLSGMVNLGNQIMSHAQILSNQGPTTINGGGTPIVPLDCP